MTKLFYIMPGALDALNDGKPTYTPMTNHKTDLHTVPVVLLDDALVENGKLVHLASLIISELPIEFENQIDRWSSALSDGISSEDMELISQEEEYWNE